MLSIDDYSLQSLHQKYKINFVENWIRKTPGSLNFFCFFFVIIKNVLGILKRVYIYTKIQNKHIIVK